MVILGLQLNNCPIVILSNRKFQVTFAYGGVVSLRIGGQRLTVNSFTELNSNQHKKRTQYFLMDYLNIERSERGEPIAGRAYWTRRREQPKSVTMKFRMAKKHIGSQ